MSERPTATAATEPMMAEPQGRRSAVRRCPTPSWRRLTGRMAMVAALSLGLIPALAPASVAWAQEGDARFQIEPLGNGVLRLDRVTGAVEMCERGEGLFDCRVVVQPTSPAPDAAATADLVAQNERLTSEVAELRARLRRIASLVADADTGGVGGDGLGAAPQGAVESIARREIDEALELTDYAVRRFRDLYRALVEEETQGEQPN